MRKTLLYLAILAVLGAGVYYLLPGSKNEELPFDPAEAGFTIKDTGSIGKIFLAAQDGESITVERTANGWIVNKQYKALPGMLDLLLNTFVKQQPLYPVTKNAYENALKTMSTHGVKVEVYDREGKKMRVFYVGGTAVNNTGTNMLMEGASTPYVVEAPGFVGYLTPRYSSKMRDWRDRTVFDIPAEDIQSVSVQYADKPENSFKVSRDNRDSVTVTADAKAMNSPDGLNRNRANMYLRFFGNINCEGYLNGLEDNDTTIKTAPKHSTVEVVTKKGDVQHIDIYWMALNKRSKNQKKSDIDDMPEEYDSDRLYAIINNYKDTVMIQQLTFQNILRKGADFYRKDVPRPKPNATQTEIPASAATR
jgi:hypothetical protein